MILFWVKRGDKMKIGAMNYTNFEQEVEVGDKTEVEGFKGEVLEWK